VPGLSELAEELSLEKVATADYSWLRRNLTGRFWYIGENELWKWKVNALNAMLNHYRDAYAPFLERAMGDEHLKVREMAAFARHELGLG
jgi:epoxyqueuosine reductase